MFHFTVTLTQLQSGSLSTVGQHKEEVLFLFAEEERGHVTEMGRKMEEVSLCVDTRAQ